MKTLKLLIVFFILNISYAQNLDEVMKQMREQQQEMFKQMQQDQSVFDDYVYKMFDRLRGNAFGTFSNDTFEISRKGVKTTWVEDDGHHVLVVEYQNKDDKIDIKIEDGLVKFEGVHVNEIKNDKGEIVRRSQSSFSKSVGIPQGVDINNPLMSQEGEKILIKFKKIAAKDVKNSKKPFIPVIPKKNKQDI